MDKQLSETLSQCTTSQNGVIGMICTDENGLCLKSHGSCQSSTAGFYKSLVDKAKLLNKNEAPNICIETDSSNIFIQQNDKITLALFKLP
eukprot:gene5969-7435_t